MLSPKSIEELELEGLKFEDLEKEIDKSVRTHHGEFPWEHAILERGLSMQARETLARRYLGAGWMYVYHRTSTLNDEKPGVTSFVFSMTPLMPGCVEGYTKLESGIASGVTAQ